MNPFEQLGLSQVINAAGKMTYLGSSSLQEPVIEAISQVACSYVDMERLKRVVGEKAAQAIGAPAACITACCAAGIAISVAACLTGSDMYRIESLPRVSWERKKVVIQKGHMVNFGANIVQAISLTGAEVVEIGTANATKPYHLTGALGSDVAAVVYVVSHHAVQNGMLSLAQVVQVAHQHQIPVIVDAAAETDLAHYAASGADLVAFSGHKAIGGPTSGVVIGRTDLIQACQLQDKGLARMMKIGKENIMGFYFALKSYLQTDEAAQTAGYERLVSALAQALEGLPGLSSRVAWDATRPIPRLQLLVEKECALTAFQLIAGMEEGNPSIRTRNHQADSGIIQFDPRELKETQIPVIRQRLEALLSKPA